MLKIYFLCFFFLLLADLLSLLDVAVFSVCCFVSYMFLEPSDVDTFTYFLKQLLQKS